MIRKYRISRFYMGLYLLILPLGLFGLIVGIYWMTTYHDILSLFPIIAGAIVTILPPLQVLFDFQGGTFSVNEQGIVMRIGLKTWNHRWSDFVDCGIADVYIGDGYAFWVYYSNRKLTREEKKDFLKKTRRDLANIAFFQYNKKILEEILPLMPLHFAEKISEEGQRVEEQMSRM